MGRAVNPPHLIYTMGDDMGELQLARLVTEYKEQAGKHLRVAETLADTVTDMLGLDGYDDIWDLVSKGLANPDTRSMAWQMKVEMAEHDAYQNAALRLCEELGHEWEAVKPARYGMVIPPRERCIWCGITRNTPDSSGVQESEAASD